MRIVIMGRPGAGKGTQAELLARKYGVPHISTGDMFRMAVKEGSPMGLTAKAYMNVGTLVPDDVTVAIVRERLSKPDTSKGFILDGFPRTVIQADALDALLHEMGAPLDVVLNIDVARETLIHRAAGRRVCECGASYHVVDHPPRKEPDKCDECGRALQQRKDDHPDVVQQRLVTYEAATRPLIEYYSSRGLLKQIAGGGGVMDVFAQVSAVLEMKQ